MMKIILPLTILLISFSAHAADKSMMKAPFGNPEDVTYASTLWNKMNESGLNRMPATLYVGGPPHGKVREVLEGKINGKRVIVKRNYGGKGVSVKTVTDNRSKYLKAIKIGRASCRERV